MKTKLDTVRSAIIEALKLQDEVLDSIGFPEGHHAVMDLPDGPAHRITVWYGDYMDYVNTGRSFVELFVNAAGMVVIETDEGNPEKAREFAGLLQAWVDGHENVQ